MAKSQFLIRNRHSNVWYGRVVIPSALRAQFNGKQEFRRSLKTTDKRLAKRHSLAFWMKCQAGFDRLDGISGQGGAFEGLTDFFQWLSEEETMYKLDDLHNFLKTTDLFGREHVFDFNNPQQEQEMANLVHNNANMLFEQYKNQPEVLSCLMGLNTFAVNLDNSTPQPEATIPTDQLIDSYIHKLETQGRKGKKLALRTLHNYAGRLAFWKEIFSQRAIHTITLKELSDIQLWLTRLPTNYIKKGLTTDKAVEIAQNSDHNYPTISDQTRAEYLGQLKGLLEYAYASGYIASDIAHRIEIPNTKQRKSLVRLPFSSKDLSKIFNAESYDKEFKARSTLDFDVKFWLPLMAAFTGARLEELTQLKASDIMTCKETGIVYINIDDSGVAGDGSRKHLKNKNSVRPIPIHETLINLGFLDFVEKRKKEKSKALFDLKRDKQGRLGKGFSNWFSRYEKRSNGRLTIGFIERCGVESKGTYETGERWTKTFHSFRHTVIDNLRGKKLSSGEFIREEDIALVMGHEKSKRETANYGADRSQLELRKAVIDRVKYQDVAFDNMKWNI